MEVNNTFKGVSFGLTEKGHQFLLAKGMKWTEQWGWNYENNNAFRALSALLDDSFNDFCVTIVLTSKILFGGGGLTCARFNDEEIEEFTDLIKTIFDELDYDFVTNKNPHKWAQIVKQYEEMAIFRLRMFAKYAPEAISWVGAGSSIKKVKENIKSWDLLDEEDKALIIRAFEIEDEYYKVKNNNFGDSIQQ